MDWCDGCMKMFDEDKLHKVFIVEGDYMLVCDNCYFPKGRKRAKSES